MSGVNKVILIGHLGADPETRTLNNGGKVVNMRLATSESWKDRDGARQERTEWHSVVIFNEHLGKVAGDYLRKGSKVYLEGQLQTRKWKDNNNNDRYSTEVVMQKFRGELCLLDPKPDNTGTEGRTRPRQQEQGDFYGDEEQQPARDTNRSRPQPAAFDADLDDDVPF